jgi:putative spermidine/putrescine transport system substrate-binding protein
MGQAQGLLDRIDTRLMDVANLMPSAVEEYGFGYATVTWGITYSTASFRDRRPAAWADLWDVAKVPGRRMMFGPLVARHVEYALMADGVPPSDVYPLTEAKVDRAFSRLAPLKPHIAVWYQTGSQAEQLFRTGEIDLGEFFNGRAFYLQDQGVPVAFEWNQGVMNLTTWVLAKNAPNRENALKLLGFMSQPKPQAEFAQRIFYGPTNRKALEMIKDPRILQRLPTYPDNLKKQILLDGPWWGANLARYAQRWNTFVSG